jgi:ADP-ribose pyrophosphatase YjhB (NUDIX family)
MNKNIQFRVSVVGLFIDNHEVLLLHQMTPPESDCWDLPGGGLDPGETLFAGLKREIQEETSIEEFNVDKLLTVFEGFFPQSDGQLMHTLNIVYQCSLDYKPLNLNSNDPEIGPKGIRWLTISELTPESCSTRVWKALQTLNLVTN